MSFDKNKYLFCVKFHVNYGMKRSFLNMKSIRVLKKIYDENPLMWFEVLKMKLFFKLWWISELLGNLKEYKYLCNEAGCFDLGSLCVSTFFKCLLQY